MKVILLKDIRSLGKRDSVVEVNDGYARNFLLPKSYVIEATPSALNKLKATQKSQESKRQTENLRLKELAQRLNNQELIISAKTGVGGKIFGAITQADIAHEIKKVFDIDIDKKNILIESPIKTLGGRLIEIKLNAEINTRLHLNITEQVN